MTTPAQLTRSEMATSAERARTEDTNGIVITSAPFPATGPMPITARAAPPAPELPRWLRPHAGAGLLAVAAEDPVVELAAAWSEQDPLPFWLTPPFAA